MGDDTKKDPQAPEESAASNLSGEELEQVVGGILLRKPGDPCEGGEIIQKLNLKIAQ
jgi:hypothetical protein